MTATANSRPASAASPRPWPSTGRASARRRTSARCSNASAATASSRTSCMPRLFRESPLNSIWEGSGNVICLDVLRAIANEPGSIDALFDEIALAAGGDARLDRALEALREPVAPLGGRSNAGPAVGGAFGASSAGLAAGAILPCPRGRCFLRNAIGRRLGPGLRHAAPRRGQPRDHRAACRPPRATCGGRAAGYFACRSQ